MSKKDTGSDKMAGRQVNKRGQQQQQQQAPSAERVEATEACDCGTCGKVVRDEDSAVACEVCDTWFHILCEKLPEKVYEYMVQEAAGNQLKWHCSHCKKGCAQLYQYIKKVEGNQVELMKKQSVMEEEIKLIKESMSQGLDQTKSMEDRLGGVEAKMLQLEEAVSNGEAKVNVETRLVALEAKSSEMESKIVEKMTAADTNKAVNNQGRAEIGTDPLEEMNERKAKEYNIILHGATESQSNEVKERIDYERSVVHKLLQTCAVPGDRERVVYVRRLGKRDTDKIRPLMAVLVDMHTKEELFRNIRKLQDSEIKHIRVTHDLTKKQREAEAELWKEAKNLMGSGRGKHIVVGPPWRRRVIRVSAPLPEDGTQGAQGGR